MNFNLYHDYQSAQNSTDIQTTLINYGLSVAAVVFYSTSNIPIKSHDCGDGVYFVWLTSISVFIAGLICNGVQKFPPFHYEPMVGGVLLCVGQILNVLIINLFGIGVPTLVYSVIGVMIAWVMSMIGFLGMQRAVFYEAYLNYVGLVFCLISILAFSLIRVNTNQGLSAKNVINDTSEIITNIHKSQPSLLRSIGLKLFALLLALAIGLCLGTQFLPTYILLAKSVNDPSFSNNPLDYIFPQTVGMLLGGTIILFLYCVFKLNKPFVNPRLVLPALLSGALLGGGTLVLGYSSSKLSPAVSYPLVSVGCPALNTFYGICFFREIRGKRNYLILASGFIPMTIGVILVGLSRIQL